jgi:hypothetical protein
MAGKYGMQSLGTYGETQTHAILKPTLTAVPSLLYPQTVLLLRRPRVGSTWIWRKPDKLQE